MIGHAVRMTRPVSIRLFTILFGLSAALSVLIAVLGRTTQFGFPMQPGAAETLAMRILAIRMLGIVFALSLMWLVVRQKSRTARGALVVRWILGLVTSVAFLRGVGVVGPVDGGGSAILLLSILQLSVEGFAILVLYGDDAGEWFTRPYRY